MSISLRSRFWRIILREMLKEQRVSIEESRARSEQNARFMPRPRADVKVETINVDGIRAIWIQPPETEPNKVILHLHGGGYVIGSIAFYQTLCVPMAQTLRMNLLLPEYRLAPEHPYPAALEDALQMYNWLLAQGYKPADILLSGDSAGGGLSLATVLALKEAGTALPGTVACLSPWADLTLKGQSHITKAKSEVMLKTETWKEWA